MWRINRRTYVNTGNICKRFRCLSNIAVKEKRILGIRREDINVWERRAPIAPQHVKELRDQGNNDCIA